jgi:hypothetical protein
MIGATLIARRVVPTTLTLPVDGRYHENILSCPVSGGVSIPACSSVRLLTSAICKLASALKVFQRPDVSGAQYLTQFSQLVGVISNALTITGALSVRLGNLRLGYIAQAGAYS